MEQTNLVICKICGSSIGTKLQFHLKREHNLTTREYKEQFPGAPTISEKEHQRYIDRNQSIEMRSVISERNRDPEFQKRCQEGFTEESRKHQADNMRAVSKKCWQNPEYREARIKSVRETQKQQNLDPEVQRRKSSLFKTLWKSPEFAEKALKAPKKHPFGQQSEYFSKKFNNVFYCRSQGEQDFIELCESLDYVSKLYPGTSLPIKYESENESHTYIPDFIVNDHYVIEIKYEDDNIENYKDKVNSAIEFCSRIGYEFCYVNRFSGISKIKNFGFDSVKVLERI